MTKQASVLFMDMRQQDRFTNMYLSIQKYVSKYKTFSRFFSEIGFFELWTFKDVNLFCKTRPCKRLRIMYSNSTPSCKFEGLV